jgi:hypothetical protein
MLGQVVDALAEQRDLNFRGPGVALVGTVAVDDPGLTVLGKRHNLPPRAAQTSRTSPGTKPPYMLLNLLPRRTYILSQDNVRVQSDTVGGALHQTQEAAVRIDGSQPVARRCGAR